MRFPRPRLSVRMMIGLVAVCALLVWGWRTYFDPIRLWKEAIRDKYDPWQRHKAIYDAHNGRIPGLTPDLALDEFIGLIGDKSSNVAVRESAVFGIVESSERSISALASALRDEGPSVRVAAALKIRQILGDHPADGPIKRGAVDGLVTALNDPDRRVRRMAACCLGWIGEGEPAVPTLAEALNEPGLEPMTRAQILTALARSGLKAKAALPAVVELAKVDTVDQGNTGGEDGRRGNASVLIMAARFLYSFDEADRAAAILRKLAADRDPAISKDASKAIASMRPATEDAKSETTP